MIDDDIKAAVMLKRSPKELRDHLVLESPQLANVENKFSVMRELIQQWCRSRRVFFPKKPPMEIATAGGSDATVSALGWCGSWQEERHGKRKNREKGKEKGKRQIKRKKKEKGREKSKGKSNIGKRNGGWWNEQREQRWTEPFRRCCGHCW